MEYRYRSPLQDEYYQNHPQYGGRISSYPYRPSNYHKVREQASSRSLPYSRPESSSTQAQPKYSSRYKLSSFPQELNDLFGALRCELCCVEVNSPIIAKMHYSGKQHMKKVKNWLQEWSLKTGNPMPLVEQPLSHSSGKRLADYCKICDVRLVSVNDKLLHYAGKAHKKNEKDPTSAKSKIKTYDTIDLSHTDSRFGIGIDFSSNLKQLALEKIHRNEFVCELCDVKAVSGEQLQIHLKGKKHKEKLEKKESKVPEPARPFNCDVCNVSLETYTLFKMHITGNRHMKNMQKLETESSRFCKPCSMSFNSVDQYQAHLNGKKHEKKCFKIFSCTSDKTVELNRLSCKYCAHVEDLDNHQCNSRNENGWICIPCFNMTFDTEQQLIEHKATRGHLMCMLNVESERISEDKKHLYCFNCRKQYSNLKGYTDHLFEQKHMTLAKAADLNVQADLVYCSVCAIVMDEAAMNEHVIDQRHIKAFCAEEITKKLTELAVEELGSQNFYCDYCDKSLFSFISMCDHLLSEQHLEQVVSSKSAELL